VASTNLDTLSLRILFSLSLCLCGSFLFFYRLADRDLWSSHEARAAQDAQILLNEDRWGVPHLFDGQAELQKPPLYYWLVAAVARLRGMPVDAWAVRLPSALAALLGVLGGALLLAWCGRPLAGFVAGLVLATTTHYTWLAHVGRIDMPLTLAVSVALAAFYLVSRSSRAWSLPGYVAVAVAVLLKGPIGAVLPAVAWVSYCIVERRWPTWRSSLWWGVPLVLVLTVPLYWHANAETHGDFFRVFFWRHNVERGFGDDDGSGAMHSRPWWLYVASLGSDLLPWGLLLPVAVWYICRGGRWRQDAEARFGLVWLLSIVVLLSCLRFKRSDYLLPAYPGAALFLGCVAERWWQTTARPRRLAAAFAVVVSGCLVGWWVQLAVVLPRQEPERELRSFATEVRQRVPAAQGVLLFRTEAHALAFHLGPPLNTFLEWENLDIWAGRPGSHYIIMSPQSAAEWPQHVTSGRLVEVLRSTDLCPSAERPLVLMRTESGPRQ
jgi:4-amino-4-deoxy-L-arabinose transferase-like glycosyltransferase